MLKRLRSLKSVTRIAITIILTIGLSLSLQPLLATWTAPTGNPPTNNVVDLILGGSLGVGKMLTISGTSTLAVNGGNVGIGKINPSKKLDVAGDILVNGVTFGRGSSYNSWPYYTQNSTVTGYQALSKNNYGTNNTANGAWSLYSNTDGYDNVAVGTQALYSNTTGYRNTANGVGALYSNATGVYNTAVGDLSLWNNTGSYNSANGARALTRNITGSYNTASGFEAHYGGWPAVGGTAFNTANGAYSLYNNTGRENTANGAYSLYYNTTGSYNTANGVMALYSNRTGTYITAIGHRADISLDGLTNATAIGAFAVVRASNKVRIGNTNVTAIEGQVGWSSVSDGRTKYDIYNSDLGLDFINKLRPVSYKRKNGDGGINYGFIAQEVESAIGKPTNIVMTDNSPEKMKTMRHDDLIAPLVKAVQQQQQQIEDQNKQILELKELIERLAK